MPSFLEVTFAEVINIPKIVPFTVRGFQDQMRKTSHNVSQYSVMLNIVLKLSMILHSCSLSLRHHHWCPMQESGKQDISLLLDDVCIAFRLGLFTEK